MQAFGIILGGLLLAGCVGTTPRLESGFGDAVRLARAQQTLNPEASLNTEPVAGLDGQAAKESIGRYHKSFQSPPPSLNVINIGGSMTSNTNR